MHQELSLDVETYSDVDLPKCGVYKYCDSPSFEILLLSFAFDDEPTTVVDLVSGEKLPPEVLHALTDDTIIKTAFNASFERTCLSTYLGIHLSPMSWHCTEVQASMLALPLSLEGVGEVLNIGQKKLKEGEELLRYFCLPCRATIANGGRTRNFPADAPEKWECFKAYNIRDVDAEREIKRRLKNYPVPNQELKLYCLDQEINDRGIQVDLDLVAHATECDRIITEKMTTEAYELTGLSNPNSVTQLKDWLASHGLQAETLGKKAVRSMIPEVDGEVLRMLQLRLRMSKTSIKKYQAIERSVCSDGRVHGLLQFYGANRTGRWAGRLVQVQNLPQNHLPQIELARQLIRTGNYDAVDLLFDSISTVLSELIRTAFVPRDGCRFIVSDFSAIEARVLAWLSREQWRLEAFVRGDDIYCASAAQMFHVPVVKHGINGELRQKGKIAELALGYGGSVGALKAMGALDMGLQEDELQPLVDQWRNTNPHITKFWWEIDAAVRKAVRENCNVFLGNLIIDCHDEMLFISLPSGRKLCYLHPRLLTNEHGREGLSYEGIGEARKWMRIETYGPKLVENIVQATARDLLALGMLNLRNHGFDIVMHIHDEAVLEVPISVSSVEEVCTLMAENPSWAEGLPLKADGYECSFYKKD